MDILYLGVALVGWYFNDLIGKQTKEGGILLAMDNIVLALFIISYW